METIRRIMTDRVPLRDPSDLNVPVGELFVMANPLAADATRVAAPAFVVAPLDGPDQTLCDAIQQTTGHWPRLLGWHPLRDRRQSFLTWHCDVCSCDADGVEATTARAGAWVCDACAAGWDEMQRDEEAEEAEKGTC